MAFDYVLGVSAGSGNAVAFLAGQRGRNRLFYTEYAARKEYMSLRNFVRKGSYLDLDYVYSVLSNANGENPLDYDALMANPCGLKVVATDASDGSAVYFDKADLKRDDFGILKASSGIPVVCRPCRWEGRVYFDGGIADPVPVERALADGCDRVVVVLTKPRDHVRSFARDRTLYCLMKPRFPRAAEALRQRAGRYNGAVERVKRSNVKAARSSWRPKASTRTRSRGTGRCWRGCTTKGTASPPASPPSCAGKFLRFDPLRDLGQTRIILPCAMVGVA